MDPVSVISLVTGAASLAVQCAQVAKSLHDVSGKFKDAHLTISSAVQELDIIQLAWERIEHLLRTWVDDHGADTELLQRLSRQLEFGDIVMSALSDHINEYKQPPDSLRQKTKVVWNESLFRAHQERIRGQATAMTLLLSVVQLSSAFERKENLAKGETILKKSDESAMSIVPSRMSSRFSFFSGDSRRQSTDSSEVIYQELSVDNELFTAQVYKRNYRNDTMQYKSRARPAKTILEADKIDGQFPSELPAIMGRCVWAATVDYLTLAGSSAEVTIEGPPTDPLNLAASSLLHKNWARESRLQYPHVCMFVELCDLRTISRVLRSTTERFKEWKQCILYEACKQERRNLVEVLLEHSVWKDEYRPTGTAAQLRQTTPMHVAVYSADVKTVELLIKDTAIMGTLHWEDDNGYQPLHLACRGGSFKMVVLLIEAGANVNCFSQRTREQPSHLASKFAATDHAILSYLLKQGANPEAQTAEGDTLLHLACMNNDPYKVALSLTPPRLLRIKNHKGWTPLHVACRYGSLDLIQKLLLAGSPTLMKTNEGRTPLHVACTRGVRSVVRELLKWPQSHKGDSWSESPLVVAVSGFNFPIVSSLLDAKFDPDFSCGVTGKTVLQQALSHPCFDCISVEHRRETIKTLLAFGANAGSSDLNGNTALHHWAMANSFSGKYTRSKYFVSLEESRYSSLLNLLVEHGADVEAQNHDGETPIDLAFESRDTRKLEALQLVGGKNIYKPLPPNLSFPVENSKYRLTYPEPEIESFTKWKAGSIPRHDLPDVRYWD
ncbi:MAG: hypothetical protein Q9195_005797 [Heterodermia aff. obscurata]